MLPLPWKVLQKLESSKEYVALLSFLPLKSFATIPKMLWLTLETVRQLRRSKGLVGYSLQAEPLHLRFWTLSAWEDAQALGHFIRAIPHSRIMRSLKPQMGTTAFRQWKVRGSEIPIRWDDAKARMP